MKPVANLREAWRIDDDAATKEAWVVADADARSVLLERSSDRGTELALADVATGALELRVPGWVAGIGGLPGREARPRLVARDEMIAFRASDQMVGLDRSSGRDLWAEGIFSGYADLAADRAEAGVLRLMHPTEGMLAIDITTGKRVWSSPDRPDYTRPAALGARVYYLSRGRLLALDAATGEQQWKISVPGDPYARWEVQAVAGRLIVVSNDTVFLNPSTGEEISRLPSRSGEGELTGAFATRELLLRATTSGLSAIDAQSAVERWAIATPIEFLRPGGDAIYACTTGGVLEALDPASGRVEWTWGLDACEVGGRPRFAIARGVPGGDVVIIRTPRGVAAFSRGDAPSPVESVTIEGVASVNGKPRRGLHVSVGDRELVTDGRGHFRATLAGRGGVRVGIDSDAAKRATRLPCAHGSTEYVPFDERATYNVEIDAFAVGYECDKSCACD